MEPDEQEPKIGFFNGPFRYLSAIWVAGDATWLAMTNLVTALPEDVLKGRNGVLEEVTPLRLVDEQEMSSHTTSIVVDSTSTSRS